MIYESKISLDLRVNLCQRVDLSRIVANQWMKLQMLIYNLLVDIVMEHGSRIVIFLQGLLLVDFHRRQLLLQSGKGFLSKPVVV